MATFLVILFVLVMQVLWLQFDKIAGKGIGFGLMLQFLGYIAQMQVPLALPIAILLSSIMALGNLSENYEFAAIKSAGISLGRFLRPLIILMVILSTLNFLFLNYAFPRAAFKFKNMLSNMQKTQPALALIPGTFNTDIPGYSIKFDEKYGEDDNLLKNVLIYYDLNQRTANVKVITAKYGEITTEEGSRYMTVILKDGYHYEEMSRRNVGFSNQKINSTKSSFDQYSFNIDISKLGNVDTQEYKQDREMLSLKQLNSQVDTLLPEYENFVALKAKNLLRRTGVRAMNVDTINYENFDSDILANYDSIMKKRLISGAIGLVTNPLNDIKGFNTVLKAKQKNINVYNTEYHRRLAFSIACLVLFFIGAPLGSIIRKGGFGLPMILAIFIFVIYFFISTLGRNMAHAGTITPALGGWLATIVLVPLGLLLMSRATKDKGVFNVDVFLKPLMNLFKKRVIVKDDNTTN
ncbi:LptF/LptG family permease [Flavobacteriaceae bacterium F08102]|nr:LptF/LptG family permease [Flavobacteriaceae bacterium F08102]